MGARLELKRTLEGKLKRLHLYKTNLEKSDIRAISWIPGFSEKKNIISLPTSIKTLYDVIQNLPVEVELTSETQEWKYEIELQIKDLRSIKNEEIPEPTIATEGLYNYQKYDVAFMERAKRVLNAGEMGTGKTVEAIAWMNELPQDSKVLIIAKKSLTYNWYHEMEDWLHNSMDNVVLADGHKDSRKESLSKDANYFIINYAMLRDNKYPSLFEEEWDLVIADEAHKIKNRKTKTSKGFRKLESVRMGLLTGTPILNKPEELWHLMHVLYPRLFKSYWQFKDKYCKTKFNPFGYEDDTIGIKNKSFFDFIKDFFMVQRFKSDILDLPSINYKVVDLEMGDKQREIYQGMHDEMFTKIKDKWLMAGTHLEQLIRLRQLALSPQLHGSDVEGIKTRYIKDWLLTHDSKLVIFSNSKAYLNHLYSELNPYKPLRITGDQKDEVRYTNQDLFQQDNNHRVILLTYGAGSEGHTLTKASTLIRADLAWSPEINSQAAGRIHRISQKNEVDIIDLKIKNSIDENVFRIVNQKEEMIDETWGRN